MCRKMRTGVGRTFLSHALSVDGSEIVRITEETVALIQHLFSRKRRELSRLENSKLYLLSR